MKPGLGVQPDVDTVEVLPRERDEQWKDEDDQEKDLGQEEDWDQEEEWNQEEEDWKQQEEWKQHGKDDRRNVDKTWLSVVDWWRRGDTWREIMKKDEKGIKMETDVPAKAAVVLLKNCVVWCDLL